MVIHYTNIYNNVVFPGKKACIFRFKGRKSCANGDSVTLEFMIRVVCIDPSWHDAFPLATYTMKPFLSITWTASTDPQLQILRMLFFFFRIQDSSP